MVPRYRLINGEHLKSIYFWWFLLASLRNDCWFFFTCCLRASRYTIISYPPLFNAMKSFDSARRSQKANPTVNYSKNYWCVPQTENRAIEQKYISCWNFVPVSWVTEVPIVIVVRVDIPEENLSARTSNLSKSKYFGKFCNQLYHQGLCTITIKWCNYL